MSLLPPELGVELSQLLQALQSSDNAIRSQAEEHLQNNWTVPRPEVLLMGLAEQIGSQATNSVRDILMLSVDGGTHCAILMSLVSLSPSRLAVMMRGPSGSGSDLVENAPCTAPPGELGTRHKTTSV